MKLIFTVTNDLTYDQRMHRICQTLATHGGYEVLLVGRQLPHSIALKERDFQQKRLKCLFHKGFLFYAEYNLRLLFYLLWLRRWDVICSIDLDTLAAGYLAAVLKGKRKVYDAHEFFTEVPEVVHRPFVQKFWKRIARMLVPKYRYAYTVGPQLAAMFQHMYGPRFEVIRNMPPAQKMQGIRPEPATGKKIMLYQGALNVGRGIEQLLEAMQHIDQVTFIIAGEGDLSDTLRQKAAALQLQGKVQFAGYVEPEALRRLTEQAWLGVNLLAPLGLSYYYSLANKFFDYVQAGVPVLTMDFPEYRSLNAEYEVAVLLENIDPELIATAIKRCLEDDALYARLQNNCLEAAKHWNWEQEENRLLRFWKQVTDH